MQSVRALRGRNGIVGFVPGDAFYEQSDLIGIEVVLELKGGQTRAVEVPVRVGEIEERLRSQEPPAGIGALREWIGQRAITRLALHEPGLDQQIVRTKKLSWICHRPYRREPFLRV